MGYQA